MNKEDQNIALIQRYLDNDLSGEERIDLENRLQNDEELISTLAEMQQLEADIALVLKRKLLKEKINASLDKDIELDEYTPSQKNIAIPVYAIAASVALIAIVSIAFWKNKSDSPTLVDKPFIGLDSTSTLAKGKLTLPELLHQRDSLKNRIITLDSFLVSEIQGKGGIGSIAHVINKERQATKQQLELVLKLIAQKGAQDLIEIDTTETSLDPNFLDHY
jgi:hypothetical protein